MSDLFGLALIHKASYEKFKRFDYNGTPEYYGPEQIKCYKEDKFAKILSADGEEITSEARFFTKEPVAVNDKLNGKTVANIEHLDFVGCSYYVAYV